MIPLEMRKFVAPEFVFGEGASLLAGQYCRNLGVKKVLVVTMAELRGYRWFDASVESLQTEGIEYVVFDAVSENPRDFECMSGAEVYARNHCDAILAVGGGSPMDCAKGIGIVSTNGGHILDFEGVDMVTRPCPPLICVPTTAGSSADVSQFAIMTDTKRRVKIAIVSKSVVPDAALIDPSVTVTKPAELTAHTGLDALTHSMEAYVSNASSPMTDLFALEGVRLVGEHLQNAVRDGNDINARAGMMLGSMYAGIAFSNAILGAVHSMAHSLGGHSDLPHGLCNAVLLDLVATFNYDSAPERYRKIAQALGAHGAVDAGYEQGRQMLIDVIKGIKHATGAEARLSEHGITEADIPKLAELAMKDPCMVTNPRKPTLSDVEALFRKAL